MEMCHFVQTSRGGTGIQLDVCCSTDDKVNMYLRCVAIIYFFVLSSVRNMISTYTDRQSKQRATETTTMSTGDVNINMTSNIICFDPQFTRHKRHDIHQKWQPDTEMKQPKERPYTKHEAKQRRERGGHKAATNKIKRSNVKLLLSSCLLKWLIIVHFHNNC